MELKQRFKTILENLNKGIYEKEEVIALALLGAISGESIFLLGPPGVAKSLIARRLKNIFKDGKAFEYLMSRFSTPDEIFGPVSISKLKNEDKYIRLTENYLPNADIVFLDEIWKAGPSIQNTLLTVINEKLFRNGDKDEKIKMKSLISASNELPTQNEGLEALWDRFLIRYFVDGITENDNFFDMIAGNTSIEDDTIDKELKITDEEYQKWQEKILKVKIPDEVKNVIKAIRFYLDEYNTKNENEYIYISDRRWKKVVKILKTSAFMNNRDEINLMDIFLIVHLIWDNDKQIDKVKEMVAKAVKEHSYSEKSGVDAIIKNIKELEEEIKQEIQKNKKISNRLITIWENDIENINIKIKKAVKNLKESEKIIDKKLENFLILDENLKKIPKQNIENSIEELNKKKLELEKLKKKYTDFNNSIKS